MDIYNANACVRIFIGSYIGTQVCLNAQSAHNERKMYTTNNHVTQGMLFAAGICLEILISLIIIPVNCEFGCLYTWVTIMNGYRLSCSYQVSNTVMYIYMANNPKECF